MKAKKVSLMELFYDLVFVYAIANMTHLIHHLDNGVTKPFAFFQYIIVLIVLVNVWMYQTIYCNRLGQDKPKDWLFLLLDMFFMLHLSNAISSDIRGTFVPFCIYLSLLTFSLAVQYATELTRNDIDKNVIYLYIVILTIKGGLVLAAGFMPFEFGVFVALAGIILGSKFHPASESEKSQYDLLHIRPNSEKSPAKDKITFQLAYVYGVFGIMLGAFFVMFYAIPYMKAINAL